MLSFLGTFEEGQLVKRWIEALAVWFILLMGQPTKVSLVVGSIICAIGFLLRVWTAGFGYSKHELNLGGPYRFVRHPYLLGTGIIFLGLCLAGREIYVTIGVMLSLLLLYRGTVRRDEDHLRQELGPYFARYSDRVPVFLPALIPDVGFPADRSRFSLRLALFQGRHREFRALLWVGAALLLMLAKDYLNSDQMLLNGFVLALGVVILFSALFSMRSRARALAS